MPQNLDDISEKFPKATLSLSFPTMHTSRHSLCIKILFYSPKVIKIQVFDF